MLETKSAPLPVCVRGGGEIKRYLQGGACIALPHNAKAAAPVCACVTMGHWAIEMLEGL
jgi:hypothetical protein